MHSPEPASTPTAGSGLRPTEALEDGIIAPYVEASEDTVAEERLAIRIGSLNLLCPPESGREVLLPPPVTRLPHTADWLLGVANVRGALMPVVDLALAFGSERATEWRSYVLVSGAGENAIGLMVDGLPVLQRIDASRRLDGIPPHPDLLKGHVLCAFDQGKDIWLDVALEHLFETLAQRLASAA